jgi:hypothetical protein
LRIERSFVHEHIDLTTHPDQFKGASSFRFNNPSERQRTQRQLGGIYRLAAGLTGGDGYGPADLPGNCRV